LCPITTVWWVVTFGTVRNNLMVHPPNPLLYQINQSNHQGPADWHEQMVPQYSIWPSIAHTDKSINN